MINIRHIKGIKERISLLTGISVFLLILSATAATAGSISGYVFNDLNGNGAMDTGEPGLVDWEVILANQDRSVSTFTGSDGSYQITIRFAGEYSVFETLVSGWIQTSPPGGTYTVNDTEVLTDKNFGNMMPAGEGKMTGKGSVLASVGTAKFDFELNCNADKKPMELEVNWGKGNKFHLEKLTSASCSDDSAINPEKPSAGFDTLTGGGTGRYNKISSYTASWTFKDAGEPGIDDWVSILIKDPSGVAVLEVSGKLKDGNIQAHSK